MGIVKGEIERRLTTALAPEFLQVQDDSHRHVGHAGHRPEGETHFSVAVVSAQFAGKSRVARQRLVFAALSDLMQQRIHALSIAASAPGEVSPNDTRTAPAQAG